MYRGTRKLVPLFYNTILQKRKTYRKLLIKYKIHFASFAKPLHFLCKKVFLGCWPLAFLV